MSKMFGYLQSLVWYYASIAWRNKIALFFILFFAYIFAASGTRNSNYLEEIEFAYQLDALIDDSIGQAIALPLFFALVACLYGMRFKERSLSETLHTILVFQFFVIMGNTIAVSINLVWFLLSESKSILYPLIISILLIGLGSIVGIIVGFSLSAPQILLIRYIQKRFQQSENDV